MLLTVKIQGNMGIAAVLIGGTTGLRRGLQAAGVPGGASVTIQSSFFQVSTLRVVGGDRDSTTNPLAGQHGFGRTGNSGGWSGFIE